MAKVRGYIRIARNGYKYKIDAGIKSNEQPLHLQTGYNEKQFLPTVLFAIDFDVDDNLFSRASKVIGTIVVNQANGVIAAELPTATELKVKKNKKQS